MAPASPIPQLPKRAWQDRLLKRAAPLSLAICVLVFYGAALFGSSVSIQGDTADVHYPLQRYFAERVLSGHVPFWTPYIYSGYPLLSTTYSGAWYPLNWPFYLLGVTPRAIQAELAMHAALACFGMYLLLRRMGRRHSAAALGAIGYGFSGFFAEQSAHLGVFVAAAWFPWLLLAYVRAAEGRMLRFSAAGSLIGGMMFLSGSVPAALLGCAGMALFALAGPAPKRRALGVTIAIVVGAMGVSAIESLPAWELSQVAARPAPQSAAIPPPHPSSLMTLVAPNWTGVLSRPDTNRETGYFYAGLLLLPLAAIGLGVSRRRIPAALLIGAGLWLALGRAAGASRILATIPWFGPGTEFDGWFLAAFGLALLAAAASDRIASWNRRAAAAMIAAAALLFVDLWIRNSAANPLAYARQSYQALYGIPEALGQRIVARPQLQLTRFDAPSEVHGIGPLLAPLDMKWETTYGYLLPESAAYRDYRDVMPRNPKLRNGLTVTRYMNVDKRQLEINASALPRAYFPRTVREVANEAESRAALETLDPEEGSTVLPPHAVIQQDKLAEAMINAFDEQFYKIRCSTRSPSLLKLAVPWYSGWRAWIGPRQLPIARVDHALMGVVVPPGTRDVVFTFLPRMFYPGAVISLIFTLWLLLLAWGGSAYKQIDWLLFRESGPRRRRKRVVRHAAY